jgi:hypothetical protein
MRSLALMLPLALLFAPADGSHSPSTRLGADTLPDTFLVGAGGRAAQRDQENRPACPMPVSRGDHGVPMPNYTPPPAAPSAPPPADSFHRRRVPVPVPMVERMNDGMPVARSGCWNPLFAEAVPRDTLIHLFPAPPR